MQPIVPPSSKGLQYKQRLYIVLAVHVVFAIFMMIFEPMNGIMELISVAILWCAIAQMHYCQLIIYIIILCHKLVLNLVTLGYIIQRQWFGLMFQSTYSAARLLLIMLISVFYSVAIVLSFYAYREFKGMLYDSGVQPQGGLANLMMPMAPGMGQSQASASRDIPMTQQRRQQEQSSSSRYQPLDEGQATTVPSYSGRGFVAFSGSGVRVGGESHR